MASMRRDDRLRSLAMSAIRGFVSSAPGYVDKPTMLAGQAFRFAVEVDRVIEEAVDAEEGVMLLRSLEDQVTKAAMEIRRLKDEIAALKQAR